MKLSETTRSIWTGDEELVNAPILNKTDVNVPNEYGQTPLISAASTGKVSSVENSSAVKKHKKITNIFIQVTPES